MRPQNLVLPSLVFLLGAASCYHPELGDNPFRCSPDPDTPPCPEGYRCSEPSGLTGVCIRDVRPEVDAGEEDGGTSQLPNPSSCPDKDVEPNDTIAKATPLGFGHSLGWAVCTTGPGDKDYFKLPLPGKTSVKILLKYKTVKGAGNLDLAFWKQSGTTEPPNPDKGGPDDDGKVLTSTNEEQTEGTFIVRVTSSATAGGINFYELVVTPFK